MSLLSSRKDRVDISNLFRECVSSFSLYDEAHYVQAHECDGQIDASYAYHPFITSLNRTGLELHVVILSNGDGCLNHVFVRKDFRMKGFGSELICCAEEFFKKMKCSLVQLTPSGEGKPEFYGKRGYIKTNSPCGVMVKSL